MGEATFSIWNFDTGGFDYESGYGGDFELKKMQ